MLIPSVSMVIRNKLPQDSGSRAGCHKGNIELFLGRRQQTVSDNFITYTEPGTLRGSPHATPRRADGMSGAGLSRQAHHRRRLCPNTTHLSRTAELTALPELGIIFLLACLQIKRYDHVLFIHC